MVFWSKTEVTPVHELVTWYTGVYPVAAMSGASFASSGGKLLDPVM
jgi:hypothetical protein